MNLPWRKLPKVWGEPGGRYHFEMLGQAGEMTYQSLWVEATASGVSTVGYHTRVPLVVGADIGTTGYCDERPVVVLARLGSSGVVKPFD